MVVSSNFVRQDTANGTYLSIGRRTLKLKICIASTFVCVLALSSGRDGCSCEAGIGNWNFKVEQYFMQLLASG